MYWLLYFAFVHLTLITIGLPLVVKVKYLKGDLLIPSAYASSLLILGGTSLVVYAGGLPVRATQFFLLVLLASAAFLFVRWRLYKQLLEHIKPIACMVAVSALATLFVGLDFSPGNSMIPDPVARADRNYAAFNVKILNLSHTVANDNYIPYRQAQFMLNKSNPATDSFIGEWGVSFFQRTPLMGAVTASYLSMLNDSAPVDYLWATGTNDPHKSYLKFQVLAHALNALFLLPAFYLTKHLFGLMSARVTILFLAGSQFFLYNQFFSWPKSLVAFFVLLSWLLLLKDRSSKSAVVAGICSGLAFLSHDLAILYLAATGVYLLVEKRLRDALIVGLVSLAIMMPWFYVSTVIFDQRSTFYLYPLSVKGIPQAEEKVLQEFRDTSVLRLVQIRLESLFYLLSPHQLIYRRGASLIESVWALGLYSLPGALGLGLVWPALAGTYKQLKSRPSLLVLPLLPILACVIVIGWPAGVGSLHFAQASIVVLTAIGVSWATKHWPRPIVALAYMLQLGQLLFLMLYSYNFPIRLASLQNSAIIATILIIFIYFGITFKSSWADANR